MLQGSASRRLRVVIVVIATALMLALVPAGAAQAQGLAQTDIHGPAGSGAFGASVTVLPNGNFVVADPLYDEGSIPDVGAVYLYDGATLALISVLKGSTAEDRVGGRMDDAGIDGSGVTALTNGNFVVASPNWDNGTQRDAGAATWGSATAGFGAPVVTVSPANSLVGGGSWDDVSGWGVTALANGNYVVRSHQWSSATAEGVGAVTWGDGGGGTVGPVTEQNSLVGGSEGDMVGMGGLTVLPNGSYVVISPTWRNGSARNAGAVTWGNGGGGTVGPVSPANSLVGSKVNDRVGALNDEYSGHRVTVLANGNYVVSSRLWDNGAARDAGAATWGSGSGGTVGPVSPGNSLVGSKAEDYVGLAVQPLANGNYVVAGPFWDNGALGDAGAATWANGGGGTVGPITPDNSLVGTHANDQVSGNDSWWNVRVLALTNGHYVVSSPLWDNGDANAAGAVTWGDGGGGTVGPVTAANSLVGTQPSDMVGETYSSNYEQRCPAALANGNYVVCSPSWDNGALLDAGAATWGDGGGGTVGPVSPANSYVGTVATDGVGTLAVALTNGNYVVVSPKWAGRGAVTWGNGAGGSSGALSEANSLTVEQGPPTPDSLRVTPLTNGDYAVAADYWGIDAFDNRGAVAWADGDSGTVGPMTAANSLTGSNDGDQVGRVTALAGGGYVVASEGWNNAAGALTNGGITGPVSPANSLAGSHANDRLGSYGVTPLANGGYLAHSPEWDNGAVADAGAVTWGGAASTGPLSPANSILGGAANGGRSLAYDFSPALQQLVVGRPAENTVTVARRGGGRMILTLVFRLEE